MRSEEQRDSRFEMKAIIPGLLLFVAIAAVSACVQADPEPTPDLAATVRDAVKQVLPTPKPEMDIEATARAVVKESLPAPIIVPDAEATARAVVQEALPDPVIIPGVEATARSVVEHSLPATLNVPDAEATARAVVLESLPAPEESSNIEATARAVVLESLPAQVESPNIEATARAVVSEEMALAIQTNPTQFVTGSELRATLQNMVAVRRYDGSEVPISIDEVMIQATKFRNRNNIPDQFRLQYNNFIGLWLNNQALETWIDQNAGANSVRGICCYYLDLQEPALYRAAILDLPKLTKLINDAEELGIDSRYLAEALDAIQEGYVIVYESFTW